MLGKLSKPFATFRTTNYFQIPNIKENQAILERNYKMEFLDSVTICFQSSLSIQCFEVFRLGVDTQKKRLEAYNHSPEH